MYLLNNPLTNLVEIYNVNIDSKVPENFEETIYYEEKEQLS